MSAAGLNLPPSKRLTTALEIRSRGRLARRGEERSLCQESWHKGGAPHPVAVMWPVKADQSACHIYITLRAPTFPVIGVVLQLLCKCVLLPEPEGTLGAHEVQGHCLGVAPARGLEENRLLVLAHGARNVLRSRKRRICGHVGDDRRPLAQRVQDLVPVYQTRRRLLYVIALFAVVHELLRLPVLPGVQDVRAVRAKAH